MFLNIDRVGHASAYITIMIIMIMIFQSPSKFWEGGVLTVDTNKWSVVMYLRQPTPALSFHRPYIWDDAEQDTAWNGIR